MTVPRIRMNLPQAEEPMSMGSSVAVIGMVDIAAWAIVVVAGMLVYKFAWDPLLTMVGW